MWLIPVWKLQDFKCSLSLFLSAETMTFLTIFRISNIYTVLPIMGLKVKFWIKELHLPGWHQFGCFKNTLKRKSGSRHMLGGITGGSLNSTVLIMISQRREPGHLGLKDYTKDWNIFHVPRQTLNWSSSAVPFFTRAAWSWILLQALPWKHMALTKFSGEYDCLTTRSIFWDCVL